MTKKYEKSLPSLAIRGIQIKTPLTFHIILVRMAIKENRANDG